MTEASKNTFKKWYEKNKGKLSEKRMARYKEDAAYREKNVARTAKRRENFPEPSRAGESRVKEVNGKPVEAFRISEVGAMIGIGIQTIRGWEASGIIPTPSVKSVHRFYSTMQITLMKELADLCNQHRYDRANRASVIASKSAEVWAKWDQEECSVEL